MTETKSVLICANPDLNYIDGSSIWAQTIALVLANTGFANVEFVAKSLPERYDLFQPLTDHPQISIINATRPNDLTKPGSKRLSGEELARYAITLDEKNPYDLIIVRGYDIARVLLDAPRLLEKAWVYLTDIPQSIEKVRADQRVELANISFGCRLLLCQSPGLVDFWHELVPDLPEKKCKLYPPVIPNLQKSLVRVGDRERIAVYAGKFTKNWMTLEMAEVWPELKDPSAKLLMIGDKIHSDENNYKVRMRTALEQTPGLSWLGGLPREQVQAQLRNARVGLSWRAESLNDSLEYSTKILEYGAAGCAAILNRNHLHERLLGEDYPLFANSKEQYLRALKSALSDNDVSNLAARRLTELASTHTIDKRVKEVTDWLAEVPKTPTSSHIALKQKTRVLVAGHDLKFFIPLKNQLEKTGKFEFLFDHWKGHDRHDEEVSLELLSKVDVVFCEWCLGNIEWYSKHRYPHQKLFARFHQQERQLDYVSKADWGKIDHISYVSEFIKREGQKKFRFPENKVSVISNYLDNKKFYPKKKTGDAVYTLGMVGITPSMKRLDRAVDLLEKLVGDDPRYCLRIKGHNPFEYAWLANREEEGKYFRQVFERINRHPLLSTRVIFDPPGDDVGDWMSFVGYILSPSDFESFHMAVGEGILTGCRPLVWPWEGAKEIWGEGVIVDDVQSAYETVKMKQIEPTKMLEQNMPDKVLEKWSSLLCGERENFCH